MREKIRNKAELMQSGDMASRGIVLEIAERTLCRLDSRHRIQRMMRVEKNRLIIGEKSWELEKRNVYLIGAGKACNAMAMAVEDVLGGWLTDGLAVVKIHEPDDDFRKCRVITGGHPLPNEGSLEAGRLVTELAERAKPGDLYICVMSGGSSALISQPSEGLTLQDEIDATDLLLKCGAGIREINAVRRHISQINGGGLAKMIADRGAELIGLNISDAVSNPPTRDICVPWESFSATPIGPDPTTLDDARRVIRAYDLAERMPKAVMSYLEKSGIETPKAFPANTYYQVNTLPDSCAYALEAAEQMGINAVVLTTFFEGEAKDAGLFLAGIAREIQQYGRPIKPPCLVLSAGEVVATILNNGDIMGRGGPSQEMALGFALGAEKVPGACFVSLDSEGTDGTSPAAGGIADSKTPVELSQKGVDLRETLRHHASFEALSKVNGAVITGNTGTNVCDINILYVPEGRMK